MEENAKCGLCSEDASETSETEEFILYEDRRALKAVLYEVFHHLLIPHQDIPRVYRLCKDSRFCLRCMEKLESIWRMQKSIAKSQLLVQNTAESLGTCIAATPLFSSGKGNVQAKRSKMDRELWERLRNPVIQKFAKDVLPLPRVVLTDFMVKQRKRKRRRSAGDHDRDRTVPFVSAEAQQIVVSEPQSGGTASRDSTDKAGKTVNSQTGTAVFTSNVNESQESASQIPSTMNDSIFSSNCGAFRSQNAREDVCTPLPLPQDGLHFPPGQPFPAAGHAVFVSYVPIEALTEKGNFGAFGLSSGQTNSPCKKPTAAIAGVEVSSTSKCNEKTPDDSCKSFDVTKQISTTAAVQRENMTPTKDCSNQDKALSTMNSNLMLEVSPSTVANLSKSPGLEHSSEVERNEIETYDEPDEVQTASTAKQPTINPVTVPSKNDTPSGSSAQASSSVNSDDSVLSVCCPKCEFKVQEMTKEKLLQKIYVHYGKEHLDVVKDDPSVTEDGLEFFKCFSCPYKSFIFDYSQSTRSGRADQRQVAIRALASHCVGVHEPMLQVSVVPQQSTSAASSKHFKCPAKNCSFKLMFDGNGKAGKSATKIGSHYLKSHVYPDFPLLDTNHPCYKKSGNAGYFKCPFCSAVESENANQQTSRQNASRRFLSHLARWHVLNYTPTDIISKTKVTSQTELKCPECDIIIRPTKSHFRRPSDLTWNLKRQLMKHCLEVHKRKTIPKNIESFIVSNQTLSKTEATRKRKIAGTSAGRHITTNQLDSQRHTKCPLCDFRPSKATKGNVNPDDPESNSREIVSHFITHIPIESTDSAMENERNEDGMICVKNFYSCKQCPFFSRARSEGSSMTQLHEDLADHILRAHYESVDSPCTTPSFRGDCEENVDFSFEQNDNEEDSENDCMYVEDFDASMMDPVTSAIKIEDKDSFIGWDMTEVEEVEVFNISGLEGTGNTSPNRTGEEATAPDEACVDDHTVFYSGSLVEANSTNLAEVDSGISAEPNSVNLAEANSINSAEINSGILTEPNSVNPAEANSINLDEVSAVNPVGVNSNYSAEVNSGISSESNAPNPPKANSAETDSATSLNKPLRKQTYDWAIMDSTSTEEEESS